ncbi:MAG: hypothetical protein ROR55_19860 [Devosia sp.]
MTTTPSSAAPPLPAMIDDTLITIVRDKEEDREDYPRRLSTYQASHLIGCSPQCLSQAR